MQKQELNQQDHQALPREVVVSDRRAWLTTTVAGAAALGAIGVAMADEKSAVERSAAPAEKRSGDEPFGYSFNTSTVRGQKVPLPELVDLVAKAGYHAIEPWINEIQAYQEQGGKLDDLRKRIADAGLTVESAIGFAAWIVDDDATREKALEQARRDMDLVRAIGGTRIAAPPVGATNQTDLNLFRAAERYRRLLEVGANIGVTPQVELWGFSKSLSRLGEVAFVAAEAGHPDACILADSYHIYKGGSDFRGLRCLAGSAMHVFHINDYPGEPPRDQIKDADRVYPGDGVGPLKTMLQDLVRVGFRGYLSLELFNPTYYQQDPREVARRGLEKTKAVVRAALSSLSNHQPS
ncbi:MAG: sugar phosphate isomerase/epimerase family protein [Planctomycetota bacterium]